MQIVPMSRIHSYPLGLILLTLALALVQPATAGTLSLYDSPSTTESGVTEIDHTVFSDSTIHGTPKTEKSPGYDIIFDKIVLDKAESPNKGFNADDLFTNPPTVSGSDAFATEFTPVPEPSAYMGFVFAILIGFFVRQHWLTMKREAAAFAASQKD